MIGRNRKDLPVLLAALRARLAGRPVGKTLHGGKSARRASLPICVPPASGLRSGRRPSSTRLPIEMLCGIVADLNATTRFSGLALAAADNALGVLQACGWMTGFPMRTGFGRGFPEHDTWRFDAARLVESGEADCVRLDFRLPRGGAAVESGRCR